MSIVPQCRELRWLTKIYAGNVEPVSQRKMATGGESSSATFNFNGKVAEFLAEMTRENYEEGEDPRLDVQQTQELVETVTVFTKRLVELMRGLFDHGFVRH